MSVIRRATDRLRSLLLWTAAIVLIALGGAGLTTAADRPWTDTLRPELTVHADRVGAPWMATLAVRAQAVQPGVDALARAARDLLVRLDTIDRATVGGALAAGDEASTELRSAATDLAALREEPPAGLLEPRLGETNRARLAAVDAIVAAAQAMPATWTAVAADARHLADVVAALTHHDEQVRDAMAAAADERWRAALDRVDDAAAAVDDARSAAHALSASDVSALDALLDLYVDYDSALAGLYGALRDGANPESPAVRELTAGVERARAKLPGDAVALKSAIGAATGRPIADAVASLEAARGAVSDALTTLLR